VCGHELTAAQDYAHYDERNASWPEQLAAPLFAAPVEFDICHASCTPEPAPLARPGAAVLAYPPRTHGGAGAPLPACSDAEPVYGSYLPVHALDTLRPPAPLPASSQPGTPVAGAHRFVPHGCRWAHAGVRFGPHVAECVRAVRAVLVLGDSHGRVVADGLAHRLSGRPEIMTVSVSAHVWSALVGF
jgi:hypothetical protein